MHTFDTIAAIATPPAAALRGIVRISGPDAWRMALEGFEPEESQPLPTRAEWRSGTLRVQGLRIPLPASILLWPGPKTYTGEDLAEIETVGALPILQRVLIDRLGLGARLAEPGEFTLRAFLSGRIDLTQAEAVLEVIEADDPGRLGSALDQLAGGMASPITTLRARLLDILAHLEAGLDFVDEADVDPLGRLRLAEELSRAAEIIQNLGSQFASRNRQHARPRVVLVGPPNAGKSRLFNAILGTDRALVSAAAGTTRDYLAFACDCDGIEVELIDTAGIEAFWDGISQSAQSLRDRQLAQADLLIDCASLDAARTAVSSENPRILVWNKRDLAPADLPNALETSGLLGTGIAELRTAIAANIRTRRKVGEGVAATGARCREGLFRAEQSLRRAGDAIILGDGDELVALDLRQAIDDLGQVVGETVGDEVLDRIFRKFCIGK